VKTEESKAYRLYNPINKKIIVSRDKLRNGNGVMLAMQGVLRSQKVKLEMEQVM
jgi:hypothetical protein